jgi:Zn-dependent protease with chaperone function
MIHLVFLIGCFVAALLVHKLLLTVLSSRKQWKGKRRLHLVALSMPGMALTLFSLWMLPEVLVSQTQGFLPQSWQGYLLWGGTAVPLLLLVLTFALNVVRLICLYTRTRCRSWEAPAHLKESENRGYPANFSVRLWYHARPFAFTLPAFWPGGRALVILSTALVERLDQEELHAVLWHETGHVCRRDFWITWLATWWRDAFFYLPSSWMFLQVLREGQEESCDAWVASIRGKRTALALASALLKVWEDLLQGEGKGEQVAPQAPGLASEKNASLTQQRVMSLIEQTHQQRHASSERQGISQWSAAFALAGFVLAWFSLIATIHLLLLPLGCTLSFPMR